jgi:hypothetical protein
MGKETRQLIVGNGPYFFAVFVFLVSIHPRLVHAADAPKPYDIPLSAPTILGFTLLKTSIVDVKNVMGDAQLYRSNKGVEPPTKFCYQAGGGGNTKLVFESGMVGGWENISGFTLTRLPHKEAPSCASTSLITDNLTALNGHLKLGMSKQEVLAEIGKPRINNLGHWKDIKDEDQNPNHWTYVTTWNTPFTKEDVEKQQQEFPNNPPDPDAHWDTWIRMELKFDSDKLAEIYIFHGMTD